LLLESHIVKLNSQTFGCIYGLAHSFYELTFKSGVGSRGESGYHGFTLGTTISPLSMSHPYPFM